MDALTLRQGSATEPGAAELIAQHFALMRGNSPEESCHVMPADALHAEGAFVLVAEAAGEVVGIGALKAVDHSVAEIKSMHTAKAARGKGVARQVLQGLLEEAQRQGFAQVALETGATDLFAPAQHLYTSTGFVPCAPFGGYKPDPFSVFFSRAL